jgi:hypothetical protein
MANRILTNAERETIAISCAKISGASAHSLESDYVLMINRGNGLWEVPPTPCDIQITDAYCEIEDDWDGPMELN